MGWLSKPGWFTRWMNQRAFNLELQKKELAAREREAMVAMDIYRAGAYLCGGLPDDGYIFVTATKDGVTEQGLLTNCGRSSYDVMFLTEDGTMVMRPFLLLDSYEFHLHARFRYKSDKEIDKDDLHDYEVLAKDIVERNPKFIPQLFATYNDEPLEVMPHFKRDGDYHDDVRMSADKLFLLGYNAKLLLTFAELKKLSSAIRRDEMQYVERWFNNGAILRNPIEVGNYIKLGNELVGEADRETEWLVIETFDPPLMRDQHLVNILAYNLEDKCFQGLLSYNFHITGCVVDRASLFTGEHD